MRSAIGITARAVTAGCVVVRPLADQFWGDRTVTLRDPFGHVWTFATRKVQLTLEEAQARAANPEVWRDPSHSG